MMVVDGLEYDEKLELQRYLFNCSGSSRTSDYATAGEDTQRARRSALFGVSVELAHPARCAATRRAHTTSTSRSGARRPRASRAGSGPRRDRGCGQRR